MDAFLQAVGLLALAAASAFTWIVWRVIRRIKLSYHYRLAASINRYPGRLSLKPVTEIHWHKRNRSQHRVDAFRALGFLDLGGFTIEELPDARLYVLQHPESHLLALVHEQDEPGTWSDVVLFKPGETQPIVASSLLKRAHLHVLPGDPKIHKPAAPEAELVEAVRQAAGKGFRGEPLSAGAFQSRFEHAFADAVDTRLLQPLEDYEVRRLVKDRGQPCLDELANGEFEKIKRLLPEAINNELRLVCSAQFVTETRMPAADWKQSSDRIAVIHDRTPLHELGQRLIYGVHCTKGLKKILRKARRRRGTPRELFAELNLSLPPWERYKKLGEVARPVPADIYRGPLGTEST